jgi:gliding motility-associated-like protein
MTYIDSYALERRITIKISINFKSVIMVRKTTFALLTSISSNNKSHKRTYAFLVVLGFIAFFNLSLNAQIVTVDPPTGGVHIDGDLLSNIPDIGLGDWFEGTAIGTGGFIFNNDGTTKDLYLSRLIRDFWYDKNFPQVKNDNVFAGGDKVYDDPNEWGIAYNTAPGDGDVHNAMYHVSKNKVTKDQWIVLGADRLTTTGNGYIDFELFQNEVVTNTNGDGFDSAGPHGGRTINDILITLEYNNAGGKSALLFYLWKEILPKPKSAPYYTYELQTLPLIDPKVFAMSSSAGTIAPHGAFGSNTYSQGQFVEGAINLTKVFDILGENCLSVLVKSVLIKTKSSTETTAQLKDFLGPIPVNFNFEPTTITYGSYTPSCSNSITPVEVTKDELVLSTGEFTASPSGLSINNEDGKIDVQASVPGDYTVTFNYTNIYGCTNTASTNFKIIASPDTPVISDDNITQPSCHIATGTITVPNPNTNWTYTISGPNSYTASNNNGVFSSLLPGNYTVKVTNSTGCTSDPTSIIEIIEFIDSDPPIFDCGSLSQIDYNTDSPSVCTNDSNVSAPVATDNCDTSITGIGTRSDSKDMAAPWPLGTTTITWKFTDSAENVKECTQLVVVSDDDAPVFDCSSLNQNDYNTDSALVCSSDNNVTAPVAIDNCNASITGIGTRSDSKDMDAPWPLGTTTITWKFTDAKGNFKECTQDVVVSDDDAPVFDCSSLSPINYNTDSPSVCTNDSNVSAPVATDNCNASITGIGTRSDSKDMNAPWPLGTTTITWKFTDAKGNFKECTQDVVVSDDDAPVFDCSTLSPIDYNTDSASVCSSDNNISAPLATDNCNASITGIGTRSDLKDMDAPWPLGTTTITWKFTDAKGNFNECTQNVVVSDDDAPVFDCSTLSEINYDTDSPSICSSDNNVSAPVATDNCDTSIIGIGTRSDSEDMDAPWPLGTTTITWKFTDAKGNFKECTQDVVVSDNEDPTISCPGNINVKTDEGKEYALVIYDTPIGNDNCPGATTVQTVGLVSGSNFPLGTTINTFKVTDAAGNTATCSFTVTVSDEEPPTIVCPDNIDVNVDLGVCGAEVTYTLPTATDNDGAVVSVVLISGSAPGEVFPVGITTVTYRATDSAGNFAECSFNVTVTDNEDPVFDPYTNITQDVDQGICGAVVTFSAPTATDNCEGTTVTLNEGSMASGSEFPVGITTVIYTATDDAGNSTEVSFTVTVVDNQAPTITCPTDVSQNTVAGESYAIVNFEDATATDNCIVTVEQTAGLTSGSQFPIGESTVTFTATDASGNSTECSFTIIVTDEEPPTITCPANIDMDVDAGICGAVVSFETPTATDNSGLEVTVTQTAGPVSGEVFPVGTTKVTFTATDADGNSASCSFDVTVNDTEDPIFGSVTDIEVDTDQGICGAVVTFSDPTATDNCEGTVVTLNEGSMASGSEFPVGTTTVTYTATDAAGNTTSISFDVIVVDNEDPTIECPESITVTNIEGQNYAIVTYTEITATDNCGVTVERTSGFASGEQFPVGTTVVTHVATDASGNTTECSFTVLVKGTPVAVDDTVSTNEDVPVIISVLQNDTDPDGDPLIITDNTNPTNGTIVLNEDGTITYTPNPDFNGEDSFTYTISDGNGGTATATVTITVNSVNDAPVAVDDTAEVDEDNSVTVSVLDNDTDVDEDDLTVTETSTPSNGTAVINENGTITYTPNPDFNGEDSFTYTISDGNGGTATATVTITVNPVDDQPDPPIVEVVQPTCELPTGTITVETIEGLTYSVYGVEYQESGVFSDLEPGTYEVTAQTAGGLTSEITSVTIEEPVAEEIVPTSGVLPQCWDNGSYDLFNLLSGEFDETGTWVDSNSVEILDGLLDLSSFENDLGTYTFNYVLSGNCPSTTEVQLTIDDSCIVLDCSIDDIKKSISKAVTPGGDSFNDYFTIGVDPDCGFTFDVKIFNRWGAEIYTMRNYQNNWDGFSDKSFTSSNQLPSGTYYYIIEINGAGGLEPIQGYIYLGTK